MKISLKYALILIFLVFISQVNASTIFTEDFNDSLNIANSTARITNGKALIWQKSPVGSFINLETTNVTIPYNAEYDKNKDNLIDIKDKNILTNLKTQITARLNSSKNDISYKLLYNSQYSSLCPFMIMPSYKFCDFNSNGIIDEEDASLLIQYYSNEPLFDELSNFISNSMNRQLIHIENSMYMSNYDLNNDNLINNQDLVIINERLTSFDAFFDSINNNLYNSYLIGGIRNINDSNILFTTQNPDQLRCLGDLQLQVYDNSNGQVLVTTKSFEKSGSVTSLLKQGNYLLASVMHCGYGTGEVKIYDATYPNDLSLLQTINSINGYPQSLEIVNNAGNYTLRIFSIETNANPDFIVDNTAPFEDKATKNDIYNYSLDFNNAYGETSTIESKPIQLENPVVKIALNALENLNNQIINYYISSNNGETWQPIKNLEEIKLSTPSKSIKWKADLISNRVSTPELDKLTLTLTTPENHKELQVIAVANTPTTINISSKASLEIKLKNNVTANIAVSEFKENPETNLKGFATPLGKYIVIESDQAIKDNLDQAKIVVAYTDNEIASLNLDENTLKFYYYNPSTQLWEAITTNVDATNNVITGITTHFSSYGVAGSAPQAPPNIGGGGGGGSSGGGTDESRSSNTGASRQVVSVNQPITYPYCTTNNDCKEGESCKLQSSDNGFVRQCVKEEPVKQPEITAETPLTGAVTGQPADVTTGIIIIFIILLIGGLIALVALKK